MTLVTEFQASGVTKVGKKIGRPTLRKNGIPLTPAEKMRRYRARLRKARTGSYCEWYTPAEYIEAARAVLGGAIDLDPASSIAANAVVQAKQFFTIADSGLRREWRGSVWLNPPYSGNLVGKFVEKLLLEIRAGRAQQAILLVNANPDTRWFHRAAASSAAICFTAGRIKFWAADGRPNKSPRDGQAFLYYGDNVNEFRKIFADFGIVR
jgi:phage N-6-adenine-methyltransferase